MSTSGELRALIDSGKIKWYNYGHFSDITKIKEGVYGEVYSATCIPEGTTIVLKKLLTKLDSDKKTFKEFVKEYERDPKSDIYSLGVLYWELTTGRPPFQNASANQTIIKRSPNPSTPDEYVNLYKRCWDSSPKNRPQINEFDDIVSKIKSDAIKKFNENIIKAKQRINNSSEFVAIISNLSQEFRPQINEGEIFSNAKSETNKKFDNYIFKTGQFTSNFSESDIIIAKLSQEFIKLYINDMVTYSDDTANDVNSWLKNDSENSKKIFDFTMNIEAEHYEAILAYFYMKRFGRNKDYKECLQWCKKGCEKKDIYACYELAFCYRDSLGTFEDYNKAFHYFNLAAKNKTKAFCLFKEAGKQDKMACCIISDCYFDDNGIETNLVEALKYYKICWKRWEYPNAIRRIPLIEKRLGIPIEQRFNLR
ncbi:44689_t:CDS:2 [Gigaspora margarita]|uniref:44689_t:CDS:1 n=1 Tax=Gigaspora margarita TaxID=4874 RepID=A0ABN7UYG8_GIGMA|nr:44689_t:CDS:2 [Gigaspora margarita]